MSTPGEDSRPSDTEEWLAAARRWRTQSPGTQSVLSVQRGIAEELGSKPSLVKLKEALRQAGTEFDGWVDGLRDAPQHRSGREIFSSWLAADPSARSSISAELVTALEGVSSDAELVAVARALGEAMTQVESWCLKYPQSSDLVDALETLNQMAKG